MKTVHKEAMVSHSAEQMFNLVNDIAAYPEFLPWCEDSTILSQNKSFLSLDSILH